MTTYERRVPPRPNVDELPSMISVDQANKTAEVEFDLKPVGKYLKVVMRDLLYTGIIDGNADTGYYLRIEPGEHWQITMTLSDNWKWTFDKDPISFKRQGHANYYKLISQRPQQIVFEAKSKHAAPPVPNDPPWPPEDHPFNLYVLMNQSAGTTYPVTIDPDVKNPPLGGNRESPPTSQAVPLV